jgi:HTH-type transcriptional regulator/antitoxin HipB
MEQLVYSPQSLGKAIQRQRKLMRLNQIDAGLPFNIAQSIVSSIENGVPGVQIDTIFRVLAALDLEMVIRSKEETKNLKSEDW